MDKELLFQGLLRIADDHLIIGQRLCEWSGHAPTLEEDLALSNIGLDLIGQARLFYDWAGEVEGNGRDEDSLAFLRREREYVNLLLCEHSNIDFAVTILRQFAFSLFMRLFWEKSLYSTSERQAAIAAKAVKESTYHVRHSAEWVVRLGDGTDESHRRMQNAIEMLTPYLGEMFENDRVSRHLCESGFSPDPASLKQPFDSELASVLAEAGLPIMRTELLVSGGRKGIHTEDMGHLLAKLQYMQRSFPNLSW